MRLPVATLIIFMLSGVRLSTAQGPASQDASDQAAILEAAGWIKPARPPDTEYDYVMTCKVRLLLFWVTRDDVGGGYVRLGESPGPIREQRIQVLFGSDPAKAPRAINRWGAGTEVLRETDSGQPQASAFFGFMKTSKAQSASGFQDEVSKEAKGAGHVFEGILSRVDENRALSTTVQYVSTKDFNLHEYEQAEKAALGQVENNEKRKVRRLDGGSQLQCARVSGFLATTRQLLDRALGGGAVPASLCYVYNSRRYTLTLVKVRSIQQKTIHVALREGGRSLDQTYRRLQEARFEIAGGGTAGKTSFDVLLGTEGALRGVPVQINYQPNWWFQIILNRLPSGSAEAE